MKMEIIKYIAKYLECKQVKVECKHPVGLLQPISIPKLNSEVISMDFITCLPGNPKQLDIVMVVVDKLRKIGHFIPVKFTYKEIDIS